MKRREPISHIMTRHVHCVTLTDSLQDVYKLIKTEKINHLPVTKGNEIIGIISSTDLNRLTFGNLYTHQEGSETAVLNSLTIEQVMTANPVVVNANDSIKEVAEIFAKVNFHALPVTENNQLVGIVTTTDLIKYLLDQY
jgi:CBS domain-containing protein